MKTKLIIIAAALMTLASCQQDETADGYRLPAGSYPLQIGSVSVAADANTRVSESTATQSSFASGDQISVKIGDGTTCYTYTYDGSKFTSTSPYYWQDKNTATVNAWYPASETVDLSDQSKGLAYVMKAEETTASFNTQPSLAFSHQLAKIRVKLEGVSDAVSSVSVYAYTSCTNAEGTVSTSADASQGYIAMCNATYDKTCWEANVVPGYNIGKVMINGDTECNLSTDVTPDAGKLYTFTVDVKKEVSVNLTEISEYAYMRIYTINDSGTYTFTGNGKYIEISKGCSPTVILNGVTLTSSLSSNKSTNVKIVLSENTSNAINTNNSGIHGINASGNINIEGTGSLTATGNEGHGIYSDGGSITISGGSTVTGTATVYDRSGIYSSGSITISGGSTVTGTATGPGSNGIYSGGSITISGGSTVTGTTTGIGGNGIYSSGNITISGSTVTGTAPGFNTGINSNKGTTITNSTVTDNGTPTKYDANGNPQY